MSPTNTSAHSPGDPPDDEVLVKRLKAGDDAAFEELVRKYSPALLRVTRRFMRSEEDARDALQDAFVSIYRSIGKFEANSRLSTWLHRVAVNSSLMRLRTQRRHPEEDIEQYLPEFLEDGHQAVPSSEWTQPADVALQRKEVRDLVRAAIDRLPDAHREVLLLRDIEELSTEDAAEALQVTPNAVKIRLHRARQALRAMLDPLMHGAAG
jgi:RNA polymerase sigma-70 factor (ECF subfamily)